MSKHFTMYATMAALLTYVTLTVIWVFPELSSLQTPQAFAIGKHLIVVLLIVASLFYYPSIGPWLSLGWCAFVPFERYVALFQEVLAVSSGASWSLAIIDAIRIFLLLAACLLSCFLVFNLHKHKSAASSQTNA